MTGYVWVVWVFLRRFVESVSTLGRDISSHLCFCICAYSSGECSQRFGNRVDPKNEGRQVCSSPSFPRAAFVFHQRTLPHKCLSPPPFFHRSLQARLSVCSGPAIYLGLPFSVTTVRPRLLSRNRCTMLGFSAALTMS